MDIEIIADDGKGKDFDCVQEGDVVILPAFGASVQEMQVRLPCSKQQPHP
jgi:4-hydroxy-3-methylbut-2-enyl diphosphate reductase